MYPFIVSTLGNREVIEMIYELKKCEYKNITHLLVGSRCNVEIKAVAELNNPGWIFVDDPNYPKTAMVWLKGIKGFFFVGDEDNKNFNECIDEYISSVITPRAKEMGYDRFECSGISLSWENKIEELFNKRKLRKSYQCVYKFKDFDSYIINDKEKLGDYEVRRIDSKLLNSDLDNKEFLLSEILSWWDSVEDFLEKGKGFCVIDKKLIVSRCTTDCVFSNIHTLGIETLKEYRKKDLAKRSLVEILNSLKRSNYEPYWDCMKTNIGSMALAESVGFTKDYEYSLYVYDL